MSVSPPELVGEVVDGQRVGPGQVVAANSWNDPGERVRVAVHSWKRVKHKLKRIKLENINLKVNFHILEPTLFNEYQHSLTGQ